MQNVGVSDTKTYDLPYVVPLLEGHRYIISTNIAPELHVGKAAACTLTKIFYDYPVVTSGRHFYPKRMPSFVEIKLDEPLTFSLNWPNSVDKTNRTMSLLPLSRHITLPYHDSHGKMHTTSLQRTQFPLVPMDSFTIYRAQGQTLNHYMTALGADKHLSALDQNISLDIFKSTFSVDIRAESTRLKMLAEHRKSKLWDRFPQVVKDFYDAEYERIRDLEELKAKEKDSF
ncbi:hypothetical protein HDU76_010376, partial [Blyttiomyces sp. JEL0837]